MKIRTVLIWFVIAGTLAALVMLTRPARVARTGSPSEENWRALGIDSASVTSITRTIPGQPDQSLERAGAGGEGWIVHWGPPDAANAWDADARRVRAGIRTLSTQRIQSQDEDTLVTESGSIRILEASGRSLQVSFGSTPSGGYIPIRVDERDDSEIVQQRWFGRIETGVRDAFITTGFLPWRSNTVFPAAPSQITDVTMIAGEHRVGLERRAGGWSITEPFETPAASAKVNELIGSLLGMESLGFVEALDDGISAGLDSPIATITLNQEQGPTTMRVGSQADMGGQQVFAHIQTPTGSAVVRMNAEDLGKLTPTPEAYIAKTPTPVSAADVNGIRIRGKDNRPRLDAVRTLGEWAINGAGATPQYEEALDRLIFVLTGEPAAGVRVIGPDQASPEMMGSVRVLDAENQPIADLRFGLEPTEGGLQLLLVKELIDGRRIVWICTTDEAGGTGAWLTALAGRRLP